MSALPTESTSLLCHDHASTANLRYNAINDGSQFSINSDDNLSQSDSEAATFSSDTSDADTESLDHQSFKSWTRHQWLTLFVQCALIFCPAVAYSLLSPFFPQESQAKGADSLTTGLIFGVYELVMFAVSPILGSLVSTVSPKFMCVAGSFVSSVCEILFGVLQWCPKGSTFTIMCFSVRIISALGAAMQTVSSYAILSVEFPYHVAMVNSLAETVGGLGMMLGPVIGAVLYDVGGFMLPFVVTGGLSLVCTLIALCQRSSSTADNSTEKSTLRFWSLLTNPGIALIYFHVFGTNLALTFLDPIMGQWLEDNFSISVTMVGLVFLIWSGVYTITSPLFGRLTDRGYIYSSMISGGVVCTLSLLVMGPSPLLQFIFSGDKQLWIVCVSCVFLGVSGAAMFIPPYIAALNLVTVDGHMLDASVYGMISGLIASSASLGAFAGPSVAGYINGQWGFEWSVTACAFLQLAVTMMMILFCIVMKCNGKPLSPPEPEENEETVQSDAVDEEYSDDLLDELFNNNVVVA